MTATQSFKIYDILHRHFKNDADAKVVIEEIETVLIASLIKKRICERLKMIFIDWKS